MTVLGSVNMRNALMAFSRPVPLSLLPPKGAVRKHRDTQLMPTMPLSISDATRIALLMSWVKTPAIKPKLVSLALATISSSVLKLLSTDIGPKISLREISASAGTFVKTVGSTKKP